MPALHDLGVEVRYLAYPRAGIGSPSYRKIASAWCADNPNESLTALKNGEDIHASTASKVFNVPLSEVTREQRGNAKTVNFGIIYGVSAFGLSNQTDLSRGEAKELIDNSGMEIISATEFQEAADKVAEVLDL